MPQAAATQGMMGSAVKVVGWGCRVLRSEIQEGLVQKCRTAREGMKGVKVKGMREERKKKAR